MIFPYPLQLNWPALVILAEAVPALIAFFAYYFRFKHPYVTVLPSIAITQLTLMTFAYYPYAVDQDVWGHAVFSQFLATSHHLPTSNAVFAFPGFYISEANISAVTGLPAPLSFEVPFAVLAVLLSLLLFQVFQWLSRSTTISYLAAGIALITNLALVPGMYGPLASTFSFFLIIVVILLIFYHRDSSSGRSVLLILLILTITLTDPLYSALLALFFMALYLASKLVKSGITIDRRVVMIGALAPIAFDDFNAHFIIQQSIHKTILSPAVFTAWFAGGQPVPSNISLPDAVAFLNQLGLSLSKFVYFFFGGMGILFAVGVLVLRSRDPARRKHLEMLAVLIASIISSSYFIATNNFFEGGNVGRFQQLSYPFIVLAGIEFFRLVRKPISSRLAGGDRFQGFTALLVIGILLASLGGLYFIPRNVAYTSRSINEQQFQGGYFASQYVQTSANFSYDGFFLVALSYATNNPNPNVGLGYWVADNSVPISLDACHHPSYDQIYSNGWIAICWSNIALQGSQQF